MESLTKLKTALQDVIDFNKNLRTRNTSVDENYAAAGSSLPPSRAKNDLDNEDQNQKQNKLNSKSASNPRHVNEKGEDKKRGATNDKRIVSKTQKGNATKREDEGTNVHGDGIFYIQTVDETRL